MRRVLTVAASVAALSFAASAPAVAGGGGCAGAQFIARGASQPTVAETRPVERRVVSEVTVTRGVATVAGIRDAAVEPPAIYVIDGPAVTRSGG